LLFEMLTGNPPFRCKNRGQLQKKILTEKIKYPPFLSSTAHKLLQALLQRDEVRTASPISATWPDPPRQTKRLGSEPGGAAALQQHDFFKTVQWGKLERREVRRGPMATGCH